MGEEQVTNNIITLVSASTMNSMKSGNIFFDMIVSILFIALLPVLIKRAKQFNFRWSKFSEDNCNSVTLVGTSSTGKNGFPRHLYSDAFRAVCFYMKNKQDVSSLREFFVDTFKAKANFLPDNVKRLQLTPTIFCEVDHHISEDNPSAGSTYIILKSHSNIQEIQDFLKEKIREYKDRVSEELEKSQKYFCPSVDETKVRWKTYNFKSNKTMRNLHFEEKKEFLSTVDHFVKNKANYERLGIPWTLGILLTGIPGCGKSSAIKALANYTKRHIIEIPLNRIKTYGALREVMLGPEIAGYRIPFEKRLYIMEDIDCLDNIVIARKKFQERKFKKEKGSEEKEKKVVKFKNSDFKSCSFNNDDPLTLSHILNVIDGPLETPGRILIITSNYPEKLDKALIRDGRMDVKLEMTPLTGCPLQDMIRTFFPDRDVKTIPDITNSHKMTPATIQNLCLTKSFEEVCKILE